MGARREGRELALQALYALEVNPTEVRIFLPLFWDGRKSPGQIRDFTNALVTGVVENKKEIDALITEKSRNWSLSRMAKVDLSILRIATFELLHRRDIPRNVTINEGIEIAKKFGTEESPAFVNGILDEIAATVGDRAECTGEKTDD